MRKVHTSGLALKDIHLDEKKSNPIDDVLRKLSAVKKLKGKAENCAQIEAFLSKPISGWPEIEVLKLAAKSFQKRGEEQKAFREAFDNWLAFGMEQLASKTRASFSNFILDFETRYATRKRERLGLDFDDLEREAVRLLSGSEPAQMAIRNLYQKNFKFIMVDEFQDTSPIQDRLVNLIENAGNLFIVGDWKQSIYGFRGAEASLFLKKEELFLSLNQGTHISLAENFRSRPELLDQMNPFFRQLWAEEAKTIEALVASRKGDGQRSCLSPVCGAVEFLMIERGEESVQEARIKEARVLAKRIKDLVDSKLYQYQDFAMLFRAADDIFFYEYELRNLGVPYYVISGRGFYRQLEIRDVISFLEILDNPYLNIPLAAVLRSPFVQVSDDALFRLANQSTRLKPALPLYQALLRYEEINEISEKDRERLLTFRSFFLELFSQKEKWSISELIELILERTRYDRYVLSLSQGKRHFANLRKLLEVARELERREPVHLGDFIRYVKGLETQEVREAEAQVEALEGNVVKLMTVHKAKGLEFKVVILPDLNRKVKTEHHHFLFDPEFGLGFKVFNEVTRDFENTQAYQKIKQKLAKQAREESKRLLYVALTRAQDHLILSGTSKTDSDSGENQDELPSNWYEWVDQWFARNSNVDRKVIQSVPKPFSRVPSPQAEHKKIRAALESGEPISIKPIPEVEEMIQALRPITPVFFDRIDLPVSAFSVFEHDPEEFRRVYEVGALEEETAEIEEWMPDEDESEIKPAEFGTVVHKIFEYLVLQPEKANQRLANLLLKWTQNLDGKTRDEMKQFSLQFLKSKLFSEIGKAKPRFAEIPFVFRLHGGMVQGTLDLLYQTQDGKWVILDYKTSQIDPSVIASEAKQSRSEIASALSGMLPRNDIDTVANRYQTQLMLYALACHELLKIPVTRASLYFVRIDRVYDFPLEHIDFTKLKNDFESLQKQILAHRKSHGTA
jgi:ATP-dependent helicase/nuclease subunit A